jgi:hypothetical protein
MINVIIGLMNSGKTLYMTFKLYQAYLKGKTIITNYDLYFPRMPGAGRIYKINKDTLIKWGEDGEVLTNCAFGFDEFYIYMESRTSMLNTATSYFFLQSSKNDAEIYLTTQHNNQIDRRIRENLHKITQTNRVIKIGNKYYSINDEQRFLPVRVMKDLYIKAQEYKRINRGFITNIEPGDTYYIKADKVFDLYTTKQIIKKVN